MRDSVQGSMHAPKPTTGRAKISAALIVVLIASTLLGVSTAAASTATVEVWVRVEPGLEATVAQQVRDLGGDTKKPVTASNGFLATVPSDRVAAVKSISGVSTVVSGVDIAFDPAFYNPEKVSSSMYQVAKNIGADELWKDGYTGAGVDVAVIDSGVAPLPQFGNRILNGPDLSFGSDTLDGIDRFGHGTHMAGIIAGRAPAVSIGSRNLEDQAKEHFVGIAPGARIVNMKVAAPDGAVDVSQIIAAIDWVVQHHNTDGLNIRALNLSFGTDGIQDYQVDPLTFAVENAWKNGIVVVVSAGNDGYGSPRLNNPAYDPLVLAVGASDTNGTISQSDDFIADFSSRGDVTRRPDVAAPGRSIVSLRAPATLIDQAFPGGRVGDTLFRGSGTSQAAAVTSGAVALLLQQYPALTPDQVKATLTNTGVKLKTSKGNVLEAGMKSIDLKKAADKVKDVLSGKIPSKQNFPIATGLGSLEGARGTEHLTDGDTILAGEIDVTGAPWDGSRWRNALWDAGTWNGALWNGSRWRSDGWAGSRWRSDNWTGSRWRDTGWLTTSPEPANPNP